MSIIGLIICFCLDCRAGTSEMEVVKRHLCESYFRVLNEPPALQKEIAQINRKGGNPDIMIRELKEGTDAGRVIQYLETLGPEGSWPDLDYRDSSRSGWQPSFHAERLLYLAKAYRDPASVYYRQQNVGKKIRLALDYWFRGNFRCRNWWYNEIGVPKMMGGVFLLMEPELGKEEKVKAVACMENARLGRTGQNRVWLAENVLVRALLQEDTLLFLQAREELLRELKIQTEGEGIKPDMSFQQHGPQLQFGNYGLAFIVTMAHWARVFQGTVYALSPGQMEVLRAYLREGLQWVVWRGYMDISACGRQLFEHAQRGKAFALGKALRNMMMADPAYSKQYEHFYNVHVRGKEKSNKKNGFRFFPYSDFGVFRSKTWFATVKMSSSRVIGGEILNSENLRGDYLGDGALYCYIRGDEFRDIFPVWDWRRIPGVSVWEEEQLFETDRKWDIFQNKADFVGGIADDKTGIMALEIDKNALLGHKTYFFTGKAIICLGSELKGKGKGKIMTSVAQCLRRGKIDSLHLFDAKGMAYYHDGIAYIFPERKYVVYRLREQKGNWKRVAAFYDTVEIKKEIFNLWVEHPAGKGEYDYIVLPGVTEKNWKKAVKAFPEKFYRCGKNVHFVENGKQFQLAFYAPDRVELETGVVLTVDQACLLMCRKSGKKYQFKVCDPTQNLKRIRLSLSGKWTGERSDYDPEKGETRIQVDINGKSGESASCLLKRDDF